MTDFLGRFGRQPKTEKGQVLIAKILAFSIGGFVVVGSSFMQYIPGNITAVTQKTTNLLVTPIFALFLFALFIPFAKPVGVWIGALCGTATAMVTAFSGPLVVYLATQHGIDPQHFGVELVTQIDSVTGTKTITAQDPISFQWIGPVALAANLAAGTLASLLLPARR